MLSPISRGLSVEAESTQELLDIKVIFGQQTNVRGAHLVPHEAAVKLRDPRPSAWIS